MENGKVAQVLNNTHSNASCSVVGTTPKRMIGLTKEMAKGVYENSFKYRRLYFIFRTVYHSKSGLQSWPRIKKIKKIKNNAEIL